MTTVEDFFKVMEWDAEYDKRLAKASANWFINVVLGYLEAYKIKLEDFPISPIRLKDLIVWVEFTDCINFSTAAKKVFPAMIEYPELNIYELLTKLNLFQSTDETDISTVIDSVLERFADRVEEYKKGKVGLFGMFMKECLGKGKFNPKSVSEILKSKLV